MNMEVGRMEQNNFEQRDDKPQSIALKVLRYIGMAVAGVAFAAVIALVFGFLVKWLWNWLMPAVFGLGMITYWQAFGLVILAKIFFRGVDGHRDTIRSKARRFHESTEHGPWNEGPEPDRPRQFDRWRLYDRFWREEGRAAFEAFIDRVENESPPGTNRTAT